MAQQQTRMAKELKDLATDPPPGVWCGPRGDSLTQLDAQLEAPAGTVYEGGVFRLSIDDILNMPPKGAWRPSLSLATVLQSLGLLLAHPNPDDGLVTDVTSEYKHQRQAFDAKARQWTRRHAMPDAAAAAGAGAAGAAEAEAPTKQEQQQQQAQGERQAAAGDGSGRQGSPGSKENAEAGAGQPGSVHGQPQKQQQRESQAGGGDQQAPAKRPRLALRK
eukprot:scaffold2.g7099.t1